MALLHPVTMLAQGFTEYPFRDGRNKTDLFGNIEEVAGFEQALAWAAPSQQGLQATNTIMAEIDFGLKV